MQKINTVENCDPFSLIDKVDVVSFDVFDTAILRPFLHHQEMYYILEEILQYPKFHSARIKAEKSVRKQLIPKVKEEVTMLDIYEHINIETQKAINTEISFDISVCFQRKFVYDLYQHAVNHGKRIIFASDITYPKKAIETILHNNGYTVYEKLFISSEEKLSKHQGGLYGKILFEMKLNPRRILHIGDSTKADIVKAGKYGFRTLYIPRPYHCVLKILNPKHFCLRKNITNSALFGMSGNVLFDNPKNAQNVKSYELYTMPFVFKLVQSVLKTQNNVFIVDTTTPVPFMNLFMQIYHLFAEDTPIIAIDINHLYAASIYTFEDLINLQKVMSYQDYSKLLRKVYGIVNAEELEKEWHTIEIASLKVRKNITQILKHLPTSSIYNFTDHPEIQDLISLIFQKEIKKFVNIQDSIHHTVEISIKSSMFAKHNTKAIADELFVLSQNDLQTKFAPQIEYLEQTMKKYLHFL